MRYIEGISRDQEILFPETLDSYITEDNEIRIIDKFVEGLDFKSLGFKYSTPEKTGRKAYSPGLMLKLYLYGYLKKIRSSRRLEQETHRNVELMWLMCKLKPDHKTIANFRKDNLESIKRVSKEFTLLCIQLDLFGRELIAIDGSKFRALNSKSKNYTKNRLYHILRAIDKQIGLYLTEIAQADDQESKVREHSKAEMLNKLSSLQEEHAKAQSMLRSIEEGEHSQISTTDPESRMMPGPEGNQLSYNVQIAVDSKHHLIVDYEVTNEINDLNCTSLMGMKTKETLGQDKLKITCDAGYFNKKEISKCERSNIECYIPEVKKLTNSHKGLYPLSSFKYDKANNKYICPMQKSLTFKAKYKRYGSEIWLYECRECQRCEKKDKCTKSQGNRQIYRSEHDDIVDNVLERTKANKEILRKRKSIVEHVFGTIKHCLGLRQFLLKGIKKVNAEMSLAVIAYNMRRAINILGTKRLLASV